MNCGEFDQRMQRLVDARIPLASDQRLHAHARRCDDCRNRMQWWEQIDAIVSTANPQQDAAAPVRTRKHLWGWSMLAAVAAGLLLAVAVRLPDRDNMTPLANRTPVTVDRTADVDPASWWRDVQDQDWLGQTLPAVQSVREGVAPLGRSIKHAVAILATGGGERTS